MFKVKCFNCGQKAHIPQIVLKRMIRSKKHQVKLRRISVPGMRRRKDLMSLSRSMRVFNKDRGLMTMIFCLIIKLI
jgi:hypothetical protein